MSLAALLLLECASVRLFSPWPCVFTDPPFFFSNVKDNQLANLAYDDLEDISPGRLSLDSDTPATPGTPETATPAEDFTHPSLGFWVAPFRPNEMAKPAPTATVAASVIMEKCETSEADVRPVRAHLSYTDEQQVAYVAEEDSIHKEPFIAPSNWPGRFSLIYQGTYAKTMASNIVIRIFRTNLKFCGGYQCLTSSTGQVNLFH